MTYIKKIHDENDVAISSLCDGLELPRSTFYRHQVEDYSSASVDVRASPNSRPHQFLCLAFSTS